MERLALQELTLDDVDNLPLIFSDPIAMRYYPSSVAARVKDVSSISEPLTGTLR